MELQNFVKYQEVLNHEILPLVKIENPDLVFTDKIFFAFLGQLDENVDKTYFDSVVEFNLSLHRYAFRDELSYSEGFIIKDILYYE